MSTPTADKASKVSNRKSLATVQAGNVKNLKARFESAAVESREAKVSKPRPLTGIFDKTKVAEYGEFENKPEASQYRYEDGTNNRDRSSHANTSGKGSSDLPPMVQNDTNFGTMDDDSAPAPVPASAKAKAAAAPAKSAPPPAKAAAAAPPKAPAAPAKAPPRPVSTASAGSNGPADRNEAGEEGSDHEEEAPEEEAPEDEAPQEEEGEPEEGGEEAEEEEEEVEEGEDA